MKPVELLAEAGEFFVGRVVAVPADAWDNPTPCPGWTVRTATAHVANGFSSIPAMIAGESMDLARRNEDRLGDDPVAALRADLAACLTALQQPGALDGMVAAPAGIVPAAVLVAMRATDTIVHTWDVCTGAGIDASLPLDLVTAAAETFPEPALRSGRARGAFGPAVTVPAHADPQTAMLARYGRSTEV